MKFQAVAALSGLASLSAAQEVSSERFTLTVVSADPKLDKLNLYSCHSGAAIEQLCTSKDAPSKFTSYYLNTTAGNTISTGQAFGTLIWDLPLGGDNTTEFAPSSYSFYFSATSNVASGAFSPGSSYSTAAVGFKDDLMFIADYVDDTKFGPERPSSFAFTPYFNWQVCNTYFGGYYYQALAWKTSGAKSQNPTCKPVSVRRTFVPKA